MSLYILIAELLDIGSINFYSGEFSGLRASNKISWEPRWAANGTDARRRPEAVSEKMIQRRPTMTQMGYLQPNPDSHRETRRLVAPYCVASPRCIVF